MANTVHLLPAPGLTVRDPITLQPLAPEGELRELSTYWRRRLADGDVVITTIAAAEPPAAPPAEPPAEPPTEPPTRTKLGSTAK